MLWVDISGNGNTGELTLTHMNNAYTFTADVTGSDGSAFTTEIRNGYVKADLLGNTGQMNLLWSSNNLMLNANMLGQSVVIE